MVLVLSRLGISWYCVAMIPSFCLVGRSHHCCILQYLLHWLGCLCVSYCPISRKRRLYTWAASAGAVFIHFGVLILERSLYPSRCGRYVDSLHLSIICYCPASMGADSSLYSASSCVVFLAHAWGPLLESVCIHIGSQCQGAFDLLLLYMCNGLGCRISTNLLTLNYVPLGALVSFSVYLQFHWGNAVLVPWGRCILFLLFIIWQYPKSSVTISSIGLFMWAAVALPLCPRVPWDRLIKLLLLFCPFMNA